MGDLLQLVERKLVRVQIEDIGSKIFRQCLDCGIIVTVANFKKHSNAHAVAKSQVVNASASSRKLDHKCDICNKTFLVQNLLRRHNFQFHRKKTKVLLLKKPKLNSKHNKCHYCKKVFPYPSQLKHHKQSHFRNSNNSKPTKRKLKLPNAFVIVYRDPEIERKCLELINNNNSNQNPIKNEIKSTSSPNEIYSKNLYELQSELDSIIEDFEKMDPVVGAEHLQQQLEPLGPGPENQSNSQSSNDPTCNGPSTQAQTGNGSSIISNLLNPVASEHQSSVIDAVASNASGSATGTSSSASSVSGLGRMNVSVNGNGSVISDTDDTSDTRKCLTCGEIVHLDVLFEHLRSHLYKGQRSCNFCDYKAIATGDLRDHVSKHYNFRPYKCPVCSKCYTWQSGFKKHVQSHDVDQKPYKCSDENCSIKFPTQRERRRHELTHKNLSGPTVGPGGSSKPGKKSKVKNVSASSSPGSNSVASSNSNQVPNSFSIGQQQQPYNSNPHPQQYTQNSSYQQIPSFPVPAPVQNYYGYDSYSYQSSQAQAPTPNFPPPPPSVVNNPYSSPQSQSNVYPNYGYESQTQTQTYNFTPVARTPSTPAPVIQGSPSPSWNTPNYNTTSIATINQNGHIYGNNTNPEPSIKSTPKANSGLDKNSNPKIFKEPEDTRISEICKTCGSDIKMADLPSHILSHITPGQKLCSICSYKCNTKVYLVEHYNIHYGLKPFICTICTRRFAMKSYLRSHMQQVHETEESRNYKCRFCDKKFVRPCHQRSHEKIHENNGELPVIERVKVSRSKPKNPLAQDVINSDSSNSQPPLPGVNASGNSNLFTSPSKSSPSGIGTGVAVTPQRLPVIGPHTPSPTTNSNYRSDWQNQTQTPPTQWTEGNVSWQNYATSSTTQLDNSNTWNRTEYQYTSQESSSWSNTYYDSPVIRSDVNWTAQPPLDGSQNWESSFQSQNSTTPATNIQYKSENWYDSSSSGVYSTNDSSNIPPSASVQDLWTDLQYELKLLPDKTTYTSDGIPMVTEIAPVEVPSFTDLLNMVTSDLPGFTSPTKITTIINTNVTTIVEHEHPHHKPMDHNSIISNQLPSSHKPQSKAGPRWRPQGRASGVKSKTRLTAEAKHRLQEQEKKEIDEVPGVSPQQSTNGSESDGGDGDDEAPSPSSTKSCITCGQEILVSELLNHIHNHLIPGQRTCDICNRTYCNYVTLKDHVHVHYKLKPFVCSAAECTQAFSSKYNLKVHEATVHNLGAILKCEYCSKAYIMKGELTKHIKAQHARLKDLIEETKTRKLEIRLEDIGQTMMKKCPFCTLEIKLVNFNEHKDSHTEECHICQKPVKISEILYHGPTHVGTMVCEVCGWSGAQQRSQLWEHMNGHLNKKPLRCLYCGIGFASRNSLRSHYLALHTKFRPHKCRYCDKTFVQGNTVKQHELTHFGTQCPICDVKFELKKDLRNHLKEVHKESE